MQGGCTFQPNQMLPPAVTIGPRGYKDSLSMPTLPSAGLPRSTNCDSRLHPISGMGILQDIAVLKVDGYQGYQGADQIQHHLGKRNKGDKVDPESLDTRHEFSTDLTSHVADGGNPYRRMLKTFYRVLIQKLNW